MKPADAIAFPDDTAGAFCRENHVTLAGGDGEKLAGTTFAVKDIFDIAGSTTGFGNPTWLQTHEPATTTAPAVRRPVDAGAAMAGRTLTDEMAYSLSGENIHYGTPLNPRGTDRVPGGSSNGSASAVAAGLVDFALGTDCGGSVRLPASYCGIFGIRPSLGRISLDGVVPFSASFDVAGWFARDAGMLARVGEVMFDRPRPAVTPKRLLIAEDAFSFVDDAVGHALRPAVRRVAGRVGDAQDIRVCDGDIEDWRQAFQLIQASEIWANHGAWITTHAPVLGPGIRERMAFAGTVKADAVAEARTQHAEIKARLDGLVGEFDILCLPTSPRAAPLKNTPVNEIEISFRNQAMCLLCISGLGGLPQLSLPLGEIDGMPLGLSLIARHGNDEMLLEFARSIAG